MGNLAIAIVGLACRFPGADDDRRFWENLEHSRSYIDDFRDRWGYEGTASQAVNPPGSRRAGLLNYVDAFDAPFFHLSPREAECTDPQQRIMLELAWSCFENAGIRPGALSGRDVGVFVGSFGSDYKELQERQLNEVAAHHATGTLGAVIANRVSHFFDFRGPSVALDTASSASLHALHMAVLSLQAGECEAALVGGINLVLTSARNTSFTKIGMLSPTGFCRPFDEKADGYVRGEGGALLLLKPLADAVRDGDAIHGIIRGSAVNHSGRTRTLTYPSAEAQAKVITEAIRRADVPPSTITYVEAHGAGTPNGDPVEFEGLVKGFRGAAAASSDSARANFCGLGSVKPNIGHLEAAAGIAGVVKVLLAMRHRKLPSLLNFDSLNSRIDLAGTPFYIVDSLRDWSAERSESGVELPRRAGISSFGIGGTNAHVVLEESPPQPPKDPVKRPAYLMCLSAKTPEALQRRSRDLLEWLNGEGADAELTDISATLLLGREHFDYRIALVVCDQADLADQLSRPPAAFPPVQAEILPIGAELPAAEYRRRLEMMAGTFVSGGELDWVTLFAGVDWQRLRLPTYAFSRRRYWITPDCLEDVSSVPAGAHTGPAARTTTGAPHEEPRALGAEEELDAELKRIAGDVLKLEADEFSAGALLSDLGFDSVGNTRLALALSERFGIEITPPSLYTHCTLVKLRDHLLQEHAAAVEQALLVVGEDGTGDVRSEVATSVAPPRSTPTIATQGAEDDAIAVIGMSGRFPQARTAEEFWQLLVEGRDAVTPIPADGLRMGRVGADTADIRGGWLPGAAEFDPMFFEIPPNEADYMDPRQRLLLQESWVALEDAGYGPRQLHDHTMGMFVGVEHGDYHQFAGDRQTLTSGHDGVLASRLGYFLDFSGPVLCINTACSAGLVAIHEACLSLRNGECDTAVAAGANLLAGSQFYEQATAAGMLSPNGVCYAFDKRANGMVMAEAVAVVVLKPLAKALEDGDRVHAVIRATGVNYDGRTNGITAPSQTSQAALLDTVYRRFGVDPAEIQHVVAHGTGTRLGDPIEVNALADVFRQYTSQTGYCALTSVKANIGHTLAASGVVSLIALVQGLRQRTIPASLHCEQLSEYIDWSHSPFYVNMATRPWPETADGIRRGAVSSFGISGTNAHVVVESYDADPENDAATRPSYLLGISAKTQEALHESAAALLAVLQSGGAESAALARISSTLLARRHHFAHRCAIVVRTPEEAERLLQLVLDGKRDTMVFRGEVSRDFQPQTALTEYGNELISRAADTATGLDRYEAAVRALADLYCQGYELGWGRLYGDRPLPAITLPGYPFARQTYWAADLGVSRDDAAPAALHPLLDTNVSTLTAQRFSKRLSSEEFFLRDHVVDGKILLPGVAHLEMAYTAARLSSGCATVTLRDIIWGHPIVMDEAFRTVHIELTAEGDNALSYLIHEDDDGKRTVFSQGRATYGGEQPEPRRLDIEALKARCTGRLENSDIYPAFRELGFSYGETFQAIETLHCAENEALARIVLADGLDEDYPYFTMHPSLFDAALNTLRGIGAQDGVLRIPFSLDELTVFSPIPRCSYCHATIHRVARDGSLSVDLAICDSQGLECVRLTGLVFKEFSAARADDLLFYVPRWVTTDEVEGGQPGMSVPGDGRTLLVLDDDDHRVAELAAGYAGRVVHVRFSDCFAQTSSGVFGANLHSAADIDRLVRTLDERGLLPHDVVDLWSSASSSADLTARLELVFHLFRAVRQVTAEQEIQYLAVLPGMLGPSRAAAEALSGFGRALVAVDYGFRVNTLRLDGQPDATTIVDAVLREFARGGPARAGHEVSYTDGVRSEQVLQAWTGGPRRDEPADLLLKQNGVYIITGGAGALGMYISAYLARHCRARLVLLGRREPDAALHEKIAALRNEGAEVLYLPCDVADRDALGEAIAEARTRFGAVNGVIHAAGVMGETPVTDVNVHQLRADLAPKMQGTVHLDELTADEPLDFFVAFSSIAAYVGDFGRGSYAAGNRFLDGYMHYREELRAVGARSGRSLSINWPYWQEGGMLAEIAHDGAAKKLYHDYSGLRGLQTREGISALMRLLAAGEPQVVVAKGERHKVEKVLRVGALARPQPRPATPARAATTAVSAAAPVAMATDSATPAPAELLERTEEYLKGRLSQVFGIPMARIDVSAELGEYGIESIQIMELMRLLGKDFEAIPGTLFFEYRTIQELAGYFTENQTARLVELLGLSAAAEPDTTRTPCDTVPAIDTSRNAAPVSTSPELVRLPEPARAERPVPGDRSRDIAIIGMSGRYPRARNLDEFWEILLRGEDCIEEIPPHRWDKETYYSAEKAPGKTTSKWGGFIDGAENFDALFFAMSPNQAALTDPQSRLFLQAAWEAMEDAGYTRRTLVAGAARDIGVYLGMMWNEYQLFSGENVVLSDRAAASNAVSYFFNLHGPSMTVDTACSSSLYAIAMAVESIRNGSSSLAFAGGVNLSLHPNKYVSLSQMNFFAKDGRCRSFGDGGTGYVPGEGVGCLLLKRLDKAIEDGDHIHGVIRGVATAHGGKTNGMTVPNPLAQAEMINAALADAGLSAEDISYIEGHGTGTALGDPIEISGLTRAFRKHTDRRQFCPIGSVKSNIGHLEGAAGVVAVTKVLLQMRHGVLVPSLHSDKLNPYIDFAGSPFYVQQEQQPWERPTRTVDGALRTLPRIAGVSSFGAHGAIAHVIIEEYVPATERSGNLDAAVGPQLIVLSAKDGERLHEKSSALLDWLDGVGRSTALADVSYTLQIGREPMEQRLALIADGHADLREKLRSFLNGTETENVFHASVREHKDTVAQLEGDEEMREAVRGWLARTQYDKLAENWVKGLTLDWQALGRTGSVRRVPLPTYPFAQERHWLDVPAALASPVPPPELHAEEQTTAAQDAATARPLAFVEDWQPTPRGPAASSGPDYIVFLCTGADVQDEVTRAMAALRPDVRAVVVGHGDAYQKLSAHAYQIRPGVAEDYREAFGDIATRYPGAGAVVSLDRLRPGAVSDDFSDVVLTLQSLVQVGAPACRLLLAGQYRDGRERALLEANLGFERSLGLVAPSFSVVAVLQDAADAHGPTSVSAWVERLWGEVLQERPVSALYRDGQRYVCKVRPVTPATDRPGVVRRGGTYLVTGGLGGLGLIFARHLTRNFGANVVLTGRSPLDAARREIIASLGVDSQIRYVQADVTDVDSMKRAVAQAHDHFGALHGVLHAAGVQGQGTVLQKDLSAFNQVLASKIAGTMVLDAVLAGEQLDFVCYFSSTSAVIGDLGGCDYAVGNRFQMAYASHRDAMVREGRLTGRTVVINWPLWRVGGMGFDEDTTTTLLRSSGQDFLETADGVALFEQLLAQEHTRHIVLVGQPDRVSRFLGVTEVSNDAGPSSDPLRQPAAVPAPSISGPAADIPDLAGRLDRDLRDVVGRTVNLPPERLYEDDNLADYGFDSVSLAELAAVLSRHFGAGITPALFYSHSTLRKLKAYFLESHGDLLAARYDAGASATPAAVKAVGPPSAAVTAGHRPPQDGLEVPDPEVPHEPVGDDDIAVIGMSGRFPGADDVNQLWSVLADGRDVVTPVSPERLELWGEPQNSPYARFRVGQLSGVDEFDPLFFEISPNEARTLDPRQRLLLQESWRALEDAFWTPVKTRRIGVFVGVDQGDYDARDPEAGSLTANHDGILASRLSYLLDLSGPAMAVNTACSSGLVAAHQACQSIRAGECDAALAAGVSLITSLQLLLRTERAGMLSANGVTYAFDRRANGMVLSEGVAVVVLKRLSKALADGDRIHGVIRASGINCDGRSNGITAPNGSAQVDLLRDIYRKHGIDPARIEWVVAHGTGTRLGDPVEANALNDAFRDFTAERQYCALTSIKPNIGHTIAASGLANLIGVLLAMRHETIPASLHCTQDSEYIDWKNSPFYVNKTSKPWPEREGHPRLAAISSFGMSGTNAHMVVESYRGPEEESTATLPAHLLVVSAKSAESLGQRVADLIEMLDDDSAAPDLQGVSATLLDRRLHLRHRCAVVARDRAEALHLLRAWSAGESDPDIRSGHVSKEFMPQEGVRLAAEQVLTDAGVLHHDGTAFIGALRALAKAYCQGYDLPWHRLYGGQPIPPVTLPAYPFARKHLWQPRAAVRTPSRPDPDIAAGPRTNTRLTGDEFFLHDHVVAGERILPGVAHLELASAAHRPATLGRPVTLRDVVWLRPVRDTGNGLDLSVQFEPDCSGYRIVDASDGGTVYSRGRVDHTATPARERHDLVALRAACDRFEITGAEAYLAYRRRGIVYGPTLRCLVRVLAGDGQALAELALPEVAPEMDGSMMLHPGMLDAALQASIALTDPDGDLQLPYAVEAVEILGPAEPLMWAWLRTTRQSAAAGRLDVDLCDTRGDVRVRLRAFSTRPLLDGPRPGPAPTATDDGQLRLLTPVWQETGPLADPSTSSPVRTLLTGHDPDMLATALTTQSNVDILLLRAGDTVEGLRARLARGPGYDRIIWVVAGEAPVSVNSDDLIERQEIGSYAGVRLAKALLALGYEKRELQWTAITVRSMAVRPGERTDPSHAGVHGLIGALAKENPRWRVRLADVDTLSDKVIAEAERLPGNPVGATWAHRDDRWYKQRLAPLEVDAASPHTLPYRRGGVYVVIGGAGGLGAVWTEHVVRHYDAQVIWIGRRPEDEAIRERIDTVRRLGKAPWYVQADATDRESLATALDLIKTRYPAVNGVVHSALVLEDHSVAQMSEEQFRAAVRAKVDISVRLAQVFAEEPLDLVLFFSSLNAFQRSAGQSNYVCGCVFKDAYAELWRQQYPGAVVKVMNWGYWGNVGVVASADYHRRMALKGIGSIEPREGMAALDVLLGGAYDELAVEKLTTPPPAGEHDELVQRVLEDSGTARGFDDVLLCELLLTQLLAWGLRAGGDDDTVVGLHGGPRAGGNYDRWLDESLRLLAAHGYLEAGSEGYSLTGKAAVDGTEVWSRWEAVCRASGGTNPYVNLLDPVLRALPDILAGRRLATQVIFPDSSMNLVRGLYRDCDSAAALNELVAGLVGRRVEELLAQDPGRRIRIFEIGAGTGGTSEHVLRRLAPYAQSVAEYCYTDVSRVFLDSGKREFGAVYPFLRFELFDVEASPAGQGVGTGDYDIVLATNVLHATRDVRAAVRNARSLLGADSILILNELAAHSTFLHLTFGLLDGWWLYQDADLRLVGSPGLAPATWNKVLHDEAFVAVDFPAEAVHEAGHQIVVARTLATAAGAPVLTGVPQCDVEARVREVIAAQVQRSLGLDRREISDEEVFADYGVDSIMAVELTQELNAALGVSLATTDLFDHASIRRLAAYVADAYPEQGAATAETDTADARAHVREVIAAQVQRSLGLDRREISDEEVFADYGVDSIMAVELTQELNAALGVSLATTDLFDHASIRALAEFVVQQYPSAAPPIPVTAAASEQRAAPLPVVPHEDQPAREPIAIVGMSGTFGTAKDPEELWQILKEGRSLVGEIDRWDLADHVPAGASYPRWASLMDDVDRFDPMFFQISGIEANYLDPQHRMVLQQAWHALEDAGYAGDAVRGHSCGVYIGTQVSDYVTAPGPGAPAQAMWGNAEAVIPARVSYLLDLHGPAISIDTACSGSLVALHLACQALRTGEVAMALAGGVSIQCTPNYYLAAHKAGMLSQTGQCYTFDDRADGFVPGEGVGVVVLKRLRDALADGDHIHGVVVGSGINQDGTSNGITAPSAKAQEFLEREVYDTFGIDPDIIGLVEAHGTGTRLGDPIEFQALDRSFRHYTARQQYCAIGSVKTNIGHTAPASGVAGLIKVLLALRHRELPRSLHFTEGNAHIDFASSPFYVNTEHRPWVAADGSPRTAALSSFGFSGTNAHVVIQEAPEQPRATVMAGDQLVVLSALSHEQLHTQAERLVARLRREPDTDLGDVSLTLLTGRRHCPVRLACVARDTADLIDLLERWLIVGSADRVEVGDRTRQETPLPSSLERAADHCLDKCAAGASGAQRREWLETLRDLYLQGYETGFGRLFEGRGNRRIPLPVYPFLRERHWLPESQHVGEPAITPTASASTDDQASHLALVPLWLRDDAPETGPAPAADGVVVVAGASPGDRGAQAAAWPGAHMLTDVETLSVQELTDWLRNAGPVRHVTWLLSLDSGNAAMQPNSVLAFFRLIKALFALGYGGEDLTWTVVTREAQPVLPGEPVQPAGAGLLGLAAVMAKELPNWSVRCFDLAAGDLPTSALLGAPGWPVRALRDGQWFRRALCQVELAAPARSPYRQGGVYVVLGGGGGVGRLWSEDLIRRFGAQVVWIGRREQDAAITAEIDRLAAFGPAPWYVRADAADEASLQAAYTRIRKRFGTVHGVVQSVFSVVDQSLPNTTEQQFQLGLSAKVDASLRMAKVFDASDLDFMLFFSSIASVNPTMGYCSYVAGNAFEDAFARQLASDRPYAVKVVNWGYWGAVGSGLDVPVHVRERIYQQEGLADIDPARAMDAVERLLGGPVDQMAYVNTGKPERFAAYTGRQIVRVLNPALPLPAPAALTLPAREDALQTAWTRAKSRLLVLDALLARLLWCQLSERGWMGSGSFDVTSFLRTAHILPKYDRWLAETFTLFAREGWLVATDSGYRVAESVPVDPTSTTAEWERDSREWLDDPQLRASVDLVGRTLRSLTEVLTGELPAVDVIFPGSSLDLVEGIYKGNLVADYFNDVVADCVVSLVEARLAHDPQARVRILEMGAGTGGTTATVLRSLDPYRQHLAEYCYTDLSKAFLLHGRREFGAKRPFLRCEIFDAGRSPAEQGFDEGAYDIVIATNVLHATPDIRLSLRNGKALLRPGGAVVINEIAGHTVFGMLTFGLLDGWWLYHDTGLREAGGPGLAPRRWESVLRWEGYEHIAFPARDAHLLGQQVVVGYSDGVICTGRDSHAPSLVVADVTDPGPTAEPQPGHGALTEAARVYLKELVGRTLMIPVDSIDAREPLSAYGIDSILILQLLNGLKKDLGETSSTLFFEYRTIEALAEYLASHRPQELAVALGLAVDATGVAARAEDRPAEPQVLVATAVTGPRYPDAIAIVGMSGRFPGAETLDAYWENLRAGRTTVTEIPADRWSVDGFYEPDKDRAAAEGKSYSRWGGFLESFADFDPLFFGMTPADALEIDPQERLFLQEVWRAFEDAGYTRDRLEREHDSRVGVFVGITRTGHNLYGPERWRRGDTAYPYTSFGSAANRVSFKLNLNGPSMPVDTLCSSSLTALHEACAHLLREDCAMAVAGGVNLYLHPSSYVNLCNLQMLSDDGLCRSFGAGGSGFVPGEGVGALILKRLKDAERDGDHIHAVIRGSAINHGGTTNGYTVPNPVAQGRVVREALDRSGVDGRTVSYVEAHGTGTALGDPIEVNGLTRAFPPDPQGLQYCALGSVKSNIGHAEAAAGIAGVLKTVLQLRHRELVPSLHADELNPHIDFEGTPFFVQRQLTEWKRPVVTEDGVACEVPLRAGVSSFGAGGANAHVVIEEYVAPARSPLPEAGPAIVVLSASDERGLRERARDLLAWLPQGERAGVPLADVAYTLQSGREAMTERLGMVVRSYAELGERLQAFLEHSQGDEELHRGRVGRPGRSASQRATDENSDDLVGTWLEQGAYAEVLDWWVSGIDVDWRPLYPAGTVRTVSLPTYPFARERYWIAEIPLNEPAIATRDAAPSAIDDLLDQFLSGSLGTQAAVEQIRLSAGEGAARDEHKGGL